MRHSLSEILLGAFVIASAIVIGFYAIATNSGSGDNQYRLTAHFGKVDGIVAGSDVQLGGVKIGRVAGISLDENDFSSVLSLSIDDNIKLPDTIQAEVASEGLLGKNFIRITVPKGNYSDENYLQNTDRIQKTKDAVALEDLLGRALFIIGEKSGEQ